MLRTIGLMLIGVFLTLTIVGGFLALDRTVLHWYVESDEPIPTPVPTRLAGPVFAEREVLALVQSNVDRPFPANTNWIRCVEANFLRGNRIWVVACEYRVNRGDADPAQTRVYAFDDRTGKIVR